MCHLQFLRDNVQTNSINNNIQENIFIIKILIRKIFN